jgi:chromosome segregation ATPase
MTKISHFQQMLSEIELFLDAGKYDGAKVLLTFLDHDALDRESRLYLLLINIRLDGPIPYKDDIDQLCTLSNPSHTEKEIIRKIVLLQSKYAKDQGRKDQSGAYMLEQQCDQPAPLQALVRQPREAELLQEREWELPAFKKQLAELSASKDQAVRSLEETVEKNTELPRMKESALNALENRGETIRSLENQLTEKEELLVSRDADLKALRSKVNQLDARLAELDRAKDQDARLLREELTNKTELLQVKDAAIKKLEEQFAGQIHALESQIDEKQNLLATSDTELALLTAKVRELTRERAELVERGNSDRLIREKLPAKAALLQAKESSISEMEERMRAKIQWLEHQLTEKQELLENGGAELAKLRSQIDVLTERLAQVEAAKLRTETVLHEERKTASQALSPADAPHESAVGALPRDSEPIVSPSPPRQDRNSGWLSGFQRAWQIPSRPKTYPVTALSVAAVGLFIIPIGYFVLGHHHRGPNSADTVAQARLPVTMVESSMVEEERGTSAAPLVDLKAQKTIGADNRNARKREDQPEGVDAYVTRRAVSLRGEPRFAATAKAHIGAGTSISVLGAQGDWLKVKARPSGAVGYVRKEYLVPQG